MNQDAYLSLTDLDKERSLNYKIHAKENGVYAFLIGGEISVINETLSKRDGIGIWETEDILIKANQDSKVLIIEVPMN